MRYSRSVIHASLITIAIETNGIIILYPQTISDIIPRSIWGGTISANPNACWDWNGWYGADADLKSGKISTWLFASRDLTQCRCANDCHS